MLVSLAPLRAWKLGTPSLQITHLRVSLSEETTRELSYQQPFPGSSEVLLPLTIVTAAEDLVSNDKRIPDLRDVAEPTK